MSVVNRGFYAMQNTLLPAVYGLTEFNRTHVAEANLVANPGCYPTSVLLALAPLARAGALSGTQIIVDSKSGVSGAGRAPKLTTSFVEVADNFSPYKPPETYNESRKWNDSAAKPAVVTWYKVYAGFMTAVSERAALLPLGHETKDHLKVRLSPSTSLEPLPSSCTESLTRAA